MIFRDSYDLRPDLRPISFSHDYIVKMAKKLFFSDEDNPQENIKIKVGLELKKECIFDLGNESKVIICKCNSWKNGQFVPKYVFNAWNAAMYLFHLLPNYYEKIFCVKMDFSQKYCESLLEYYIRNNYMFIPKEVKLYDYYGDTQIVEYPFDKIKSVIGK